MICVKRPLILSAEMHKVFFSLVVKIFKVMSTFLCVFFVKFTNGNVKYYNYYLSAFMKFENPYYYQV